MKKLIAHSITLGLLLNLFGATQLTARVSQQPSQPSGFINNPALPPEKPLPTQPVIQPYNPSVVAPITVPTKQDIDKQIATIKKTIKGLKTINTVTATLLIGGAVTGITIGIAVIVGGAALAIIIPGAIAAEGAVAAAPLLAAASSAAATIGAINAGTYVVSSATAATAASIGMSATGTILAINTATLAANAAALATVSATTAATTAAATTVISNVIIGGMVASLVAGSLGAVGLTVFGGLSTATILTALIEAKKLEDIEKKQPGTLTADQKLTITQFKNVVKGPIAKGIAQGLQLKKIKNTLSTNVLTQNPNLLAMLGGAKKAQTFIEKYFEATKKLNNLKMAYNTYKLGKKTLQKEREQYKKLSSKHIKLDLKIAGLDLKFALIPLQLSAQEKKINKLHKKYPGIEKTLASAVQTFITESDRIIAELASPTK